MLKHVNPHNQHILFPVYHNCSQIKMKKRKFLIVIYTYWIVLMLFMTI